MKNQLFAIEIDFSNESADDILHDPIQFQECLQNLHDSYPEMVCLQANKHIYILAVGYNITSMLDELFPFFSNERSIMLAPSEEGAYTTLLKIAQGKHWKDVSPEYVKIAIHESASVAREHGTLGVILKPMLEKAWCMNAYAISQRHIRKEAHAFVSLPIRNFDYSLVSLN